VSIFDNFLLDGKVAIITGDSKGIGAAIAKAFAEAGGDVVIGARAVADLESVAAQITSMARRALVVQTDVLEFARYWQLNFLRPQQLSLRSHATALSHSANALILRSR
jgi:NAD(P)-dependent dehydrogenase (short-subunit alcohol dehydrogenase family)